MRNQQSLNLTLEHCQRVGKVTNLLPMLLEIDLCAVRAADMTLAPDQLHSVVGLARAA